jgi:regulatory protein
LNKFIKSNEETFILEQDPLYQKAKSLAEAYCSRRECCLSEVRAYLKRKKVADKFSEEILKHLVKNQWLNEHRYLPLYVRAQARAGKSVRVIEQKLKQKGLRLSPEEVITIIKELTGISELQRAKEFIFRRYPKFSQDIKIQQKAFQALVRRGYPIEIASKAVKSEEPIVE